MLVLGICAAYSLDRVLDAPRFASPWITRVLAATSIAAVVACGMLLPTLPLQTAVLVPVVGLLAATYPFLKRLPLWKTVLVPLVWTWCAIALPFNDGSWFGWHWMHEPVAVPLFLVMAAGCLFCDLKDERRDRAAGIASLPAVLGSTAATWIAVGVALTGGAVALAEGRLGLSCSALVLSSVALRPALLATDIVGPLVVDVILTLPGVLIAARVI